MILHVTLEPNIEKTIESVDIEDLGFNSIEEWNDFDEWRKKEILMDHFTDKIYGMVTNIEEQP
jgi:hypothetical protein